MAEQNKRPDTVSLEVKTYVNERGRHIMLLSCHLDVVKELSMGFLPDYALIKQRVEKGQFGNTQMSETYDMRLVDGYMRIIMDRSSMVPFNAQGKIVEEVFSIYPREKLCDYLLNEGWELLAMALGPQGEIVEKWMKKKQETGGDYTSKEDDKEISPIRKVPKKD